MWIMRYKFGNKIRPQRETLTDASGRPNHAQVSCYRRSKEKKERIAVSELS